MSGNFEHLRYQMRKGYQHAMIASSDSDCGDINLLFRNITRLIGSISKVQETCPDTLCCDDKVAGSNAPMALVAPYMQLSSNTAISSNC